MKTTAKLAGVTLTLSVAVWAYLRLRFPSDPPTFEEDLVILAAVWLIVLFVWRLFGRLKKSSGDE